jgi:hypothetical protein
MGLIRFQLSCSRSFAYPDAENLQKANALSKELQQPLEVYMRVEVDQDA